MKIKKSDLNAIIGLLGVLIAICAYQFGCKSLDLKTEELAKQNDLIEADIRVYRAWQASEASFITRTIDMEDQIEDWLWEFPSNILVEDELKFAYQLDNANPQNYLFINSMSFGIMEEMYVTDYLAQGETETAEMMTPVTIDDTLFPVCTLYKYPVNLGMNCTYNGFKNYVSRLHIGDRRREIENVTLNYDESTGQLVGSLTVNAYYVAGTDKLYEQPSLPAVSTGTDNIFGTMDAILPDYLQFGTIENELTEGVTGELEGEGTEGESTDAAESDDVGTTTGNRNTTNNTRRTNTTANR